MKSLNIYAEKKLATLTEKGLKRDIVTTTRQEKSQVIRAGKKLISFCCNDYLNLNHHPKVRQAAKDAIDLFGSGAGSSRLVTGNHPLISTLESRLARLKGTEDCCLFSSGYMANIGIIPALVGPDDVIYLDALSHACLQAGSDLSRAKKIIFRHNDMAHLESLLMQSRTDHPRALIVTDGVFSMDGDLAPLDRLGVLAANHDAWLMSDDAHGLGVMGNEAGSRHMFDPLPDIPLQMGTLSKAGGSFGGYLCASRPVIALMKSRARSLIYTTALPPASVAAALAALDIIESEPAYCQKPLNNARLFSRRLGLPVPQSPIVPIIIGDTARTMAHAAVLATDGFLVTGIRPPTVPEGTARLRFTFTAAHQPRDIERLTNSIIKHDIMPSNTRQDRL